MIEDGAPQVQKVAMIDIHTVESTPSIISCPSTAGYFRGEVVLGGSVVGRSVLKRELMSGQRRPGDAITVRINIG